MKQDYKGYRGESTPYIDLEAAHFLGMIWSKLFARGVLTKTTYFDGLQKLDWSDDFVHRDILDTVLTARLDELKFGPGSVELAQYLIVYRDLIRDSKIRCLERISAMDSKEGQ